MPQYVQKLKEEREAPLKLHVPIFSLAQDDKVVLPGNLTGTYKQVVDCGQSWSDFVLDPANSESGARACAEVVAVAFPERRELPDQALVIVQRWTQA